MAHSYADCDEQAVDRIKENARKSIDEHLEEAIWRKNREIRDITVGSIM